MGAKHDVATAVERDPLPLEAATLRDLGPWPCPPDAQPAPRVDDPVPRHGRVLREREERVPHEPRVAGQLREHGDVAIRGHATRRDGAYHAHDPVMLARRLCLHGRSRPG